MPIQIDPNTGERVGTAPQIDPQTGERVEGVSTMTVSPPSPFANNPGPGKPGGYEEALRPIGNIGRRAVSDIGAMAHQLVTPSDWAINKPANYDNPISGYIRTAKQDGPIQALTDAGGDALAMTLTGKAIDAAGEAGTSLRRLGATVDNAVIGTPADAMEHGANPGRALSSNRIIGSNPASLAPKLKAIIPDAAAEHRAIVASNPSSATLNVGPMISDPFDQIIADKTNPRTGVAQPAQIKKAGTTQRILTHVLDSTTGGTTPMLRDPNLSPLEATELKSNIYDMTDYDNPSKAALSNKGLKMAAHNLKVGVDQAVPESVPAGQRLHDLMAAKDVLEPQARLVKLPTSKSGLIDRLTTTLGTTAGAGMDVGGSGLQRIGANNYLRFLIPPAIPNSRK